MLRSLSRCLAISAFPMAYSKSGDFKGIFESPFVAISDGVEVLGSEGKVGRFGQFKVEIQTASSNTTFGICKVTGGSETFLADATTDDDGELKAVGGAGSIAVGNYAEFSFRVRTDSANDCSGTLMWESGFSVVPPA